MYNHPQNQPPQGGNGGDAHGGQPLGWGGSANQPWQGQPAANGGAWGNRNNVNQNVPQSSVAGQFVYSGDLNQGRGASSPRGSSGMDSQRKKMLITIASCLLAAVLVIGGVAAFMKLGNSTQPNTHLNPVTSVVTATATDSQTPVDTATAMATATLESSTPTIGVVPTTAGAHPTAMPTKAVMAAPTKVPTATPTKAATPTATTLPLPPEPNPLVPATCPMPTVASADYPQPYDPEKYHYTIDSSEIVNGVPVAGILLIYPPCDFCNAEVKGSGWRCAPDFWTNTSGAVVVCKLNTVWNTRIVSHAGPAGCANYGGYPGFDFYRHNGASIASTAPAVNRPDDVLLIA